MPRISAGLAGVTAIDTRTASVTVNVPEPETPDNVASTVTDPVEWLVAKPEPEIVATLLFEEDQVTVAVMS